VNRARKAQERVRRAGVRLGRALWLVGALGLAGCALPGGGPGPGAGSPPDAHAPAPRLAASLMPTDFGRSVADAVRTHPLIGAEAARIGAAQAEVAGARSRLGPRIALGLDATLGLLGGGSGVGQSLPVLSVSQLLFDAGASRARIAAAEAGVVERTILREAAASQVALLAVQGWSDLHHQRRLLALAEANLAVHETFLAQVQDRLSAGAGTESDLLTARSRLAAASARRVAVQGALERAEAIWREVFALPPPATLAAPPAAPALPALPEADLIATSPRIRSLAAQRRAAEAVAEAVRAARWPSVGLDILAQRDLKAGETTAEAQLRPRLDLDMTGQRAAAIAQAEADVAGLRARQQELSRQIGRALAVLRSDARTGQARLAAVREAQAASEAAVGAAQSQFSVGRSSISALLDAQRDLFEASQNLAAAEQELTLSAYAALALTGDILDVFGILLPQVVGGAAQPSVVPPEVLSAARGPGG
jgi:adhesin transport system outer membrane protein